VLHLVNISVRGEEGGEGGIEDLSPKGMHLIFNEYLMKQNSHSSNYISPNYSCWYVNMFDRTFIQ